MKETTFIMKLWSDFNMYFATEEITEDLENLNNPTFFEELIREFDWNSISQEIVLAAIRILFTLIVFLIIHLIAKSFIKLFFKRFKQSKRTDPSRYETVLRVIKNIYRVIFYFFLIYTILEILNFPVGTLLASAGIVGLTVSLGAQGFVSDLVNGFTILGARQLSIGDEVRIDDVSGTVLNLGLRSTEIKDFDGTIHYIPNREILIISNRSKGDMRALIDIRLFPETDTFKVRELIQQVNDELIPTFPDITVPPNDILFVSNDKNQLTMRVIMYTKPGSQYGVQNKFYEIYVNSIIDAGHDLPYGDIDFEKES